MMAQINLLICNIMLLEYVIRNERVVGSNPISGSKENKRFPRNREPLLSCLFSFENYLSVTCLKTLLLFYY